MFGRNGKHPGTGKGMMIILWSTPEDLAAVAPILCGPAKRETFHVDIRT